MIEHVSPAIQAETTDQSRQQQRRLSVATTRTQPAGADLIKAHVTLLEHEVVLSKQGDMFRLVQHHYHRLQTWHDQHTGWRIQRSSTVIRLIRHLSATTPGYLYDRLRDPRDFACLTWLLWYSEQRQLSGRGNDQQFLLSQLAEQIQEQSKQNAEDGEGFDFRRPVDRYSIQRALQYLEGLGGLQLVDGQTREWVEQAADVLYEFTDVARSLVSSLNAQLVTQVATRLSEPQTSFQPTRIQDIAGIPPQARAWRALLLGPAFFRFDDPEAFAVLQQQIGILAEELLTTFGWLLDLQRDYACIIRASGSSAGPVNALTPYGTNDQIALLICSAIREHVQRGIWPAPDIYGCLHVTTEDMADLFYTVRERHGENWGNEARHKGAQSLLNDVYRKMRQIGLLRGPDRSGHLLILPTTARYSASYEKATAERTGSTAATRNRSKAKMRPKKDAQAQIQSELF